MTVFEILSFNKELLRRLCDVGVKADDYRYVDLFRDYTKLVGNSLKNRPIFFDKTGLMC